MIALVRSPEDPPDVSDAELPALFTASPVRAWRVFIDHHSGAILAFIERIGIRDPDEVMEVYVATCQRLSDGNCARLRNWDPEKGSLRAWLSVVVRNACIDWVRSRAGRRRLFRNIAELDSFHQQVFEQFFWSGLTPGEIAEHLAATRQERVLLADVLDALDHIHAILTERQKGELLSLAARKQVQGLNTEDSSDKRLIDRSVDVEGHVHTREIRGLFDEALTRLSPQESAVLRLKYVQGLSHERIKRALHLPDLTYGDVKAIEKKLKGLLEETMTNRSSWNGVPFLEEGRP